jgi:hypothetical protein
MFALKKNFVTRRQNILVNLSKGFGATLAIGRLTSLKPNEEV